MRKMLSRDELRKEIEKLKKAGKKIIFTNGCFDILHTGHTRYLREARKLGDILVVGINSDTSVRAIKGPQRPIVPQDERADIMASLESVDFVILFDEATPLELIEYLKPHTIVKGGDWSEKDIVGREAVKKWGGTVAVIPEIKGASTTNIIEKILLVYGNKK
jgi:rfaE bifunctional protein nucleotidyltransferase chain/domain